MTYTDAYEKSKTPASTTKIYSLVEIPEAKVNPINKLPALDVASYSRADKKTYFVSLEGYHAISSMMLFKIDKLCNSVQHNSYVSG